jgi:hypothetical protein
MLCIIASGVTPWYSHPEVAVAREIQSVFSVEADLRA